MQEPVEYVIWEVMDYHQDGMVTENRFVSGNSNDSIESVRKMKEKEWPKESSDMTRFSDVGVT